jgi:hypothetical protein
MTQRVLVVRHPSAVFDQIFVSDCWASPAQSFSGPTPEGLMNVFHYFRSLVRIKFTLWLTANQPISYGVKYLLGLKIRFMISPDSCDFEDVGRPFWRVVRSGIFSKSFGKFASGTTTRIRNALRLAAYRQLFSFRANPLRFTIILGFETDHLRS